ncbi:MAG: hypothetical protein QGG39_18685 [Candidatus Poribacteria bacterium]|nr:hypothetical protein [Candidatus Poribacteria bacterium]
MSCEGDGAKTQVLDQRTALMTVVVPQHSLYPKLMARLKTQPAQLPLCQ